MSKDYKARDLRSIAAAFTSFKCLLAGIASLRVMDEDGLRADQSAMGAINRPLRFIRKDDAEYVIITHPQSLPLHWDGSSSAAIVW